MEVASFLRNVHTLFFGANICIKILRRKSLPHAKSQRISLLFLVVPT